MTPEIEARIEQRRNFIKTLEETAEIAEACGEPIGKAILFSLIGALLTNREHELAKHMVDFSMREMALVQAQIAEIEAKGEQG